MEWDYKKTLRKLTSKALWTLLPALFAVSAFGQNGPPAPAECGALGGPGQVGPFDYRTDRANDVLGKVDRAHFPSYVEALLRGKSHALPGQDIDYTLRAFPNHHAALEAMMRYGEKMKSPMPNGAKFTVECYFERATRFRPDDAIVRMIYAIYLSRNTRVPEASHQLERAAVIAGDNPFTHNNIGLVYFDMKNYDRALVQAHKAIDLGLVQTPLREKLQGVGKWTESSSPVAPPASSKNTDAANPASAGLTPSSPAAVSN